MYYYTNVGVSTHTTVSETYWLNGISIRHQGKFNRKHLTCPAGKFLAFQEKFLKAIVCNRGNQLQKVFYITYKFTVPDDGEYVSKTVYGTMLCYLECLKGNEASRIEFSTP